MKKVLTIAAVASLAMISCKKDYTCECTASENGQVFSTVSYTGKMKKSDADSWCTNNATSVTSGTTTIKQTCKLK